MFCETSDELQTECIHFHHLTALKEISIVTDQPTISLLLFHTTPYHHEFNDTCDGEEIVIYPVPACFTTPGSRSIAPCDVFPWRTRSVPRRFLIVYGENKYLKNLYIPHSILKCEACPILF